ncbi:hypothetical protein JIQ42_04152 [Leishmania sp. Namibia]|uniref:hypothetical protein n=1 Tax=Leishmania sp. Namibia TaxID=2802991 RepID=UPI001B60ABB3|nr:hypothetical protein JIQ42_04152 [Leishmania sp. Namibia]
MYGRLNATSSEAALATRVIVSPHSRRSVHRQACHSSVCTPHPSYQQLKSDAVRQGTPQRFGNTCCCWGGCEGEPHRSRPLPTSQAASGCSSSVHAHQHRHHHDPSVRHSTDAAFMKSEATLSVSVSLAPTTDATHARRMKHGPCSQAHDPRSAASAFAQQLPPHEVQTLSLGSRRRASDCAMAEDRAPEERLARLHRAGQLSPPSLPLLGPPRGSATPKADIVRRSTSSPRSLSSRRVPSRVRRLLCKLEAEAQRTGRTVADVVDGSRDTVALYQALFLQALADGAAWERHARALEASAQASAKREARLIRQLRHARRIVELLATYVEGAEWVADVLGRGAASGAGASTQTDRAVPEGTPPMPSSALAESAAEGAAAAAESSYLCSSVSRSAVSELMRGSFGRSLNLAYGISGSDSRHEEDGDDAETVAIAAGDAAMRRTDGGWHAAAVKGSGGGRAPDRLLSEPSALVQEVGERRWDQSSWGNIVDDVSRGVPARDVATTAWWDEGGGAAVQRLCRGRTEGFEICTSSGREPPAAACAFEMSHCQATLPPPHPVTSARAAAVPEGDASHRPASSPSLPPSFVHDTAIRTAMRTESSVNGSALVDAAATAAAALQPAPSSAAQSLLELLRSRETATTAAAVVGQAPAYTSAGTAPKTTSQIAAVHHSVDYEVTVAEATRSRSSNDTAQSRWALPAMAPSSSSSALRPPLTTPSHSPIPRRSPEPKSGGSVSHAASLPSSASSSLPWAHSHALPPPLPRSAHSGSSSAMSAKGGAATAAPIAVTELVCMPPPAPLSFLPGQPSTHIADTRQGDGSAVEHSDGGPAYSSNYRESLETASTADCSAASSSFSFERQLDESRGEHHRLASSSEEIPYERPEVVGSDGYAKWRAQLEEHLNRDWASGM